MCKQPLQQSQQTESALRSVIDILIDGQEAFRQLSDELEDKSLKSRFMTESLKLAQFRGDFESLLHREGVAGVKESGTTAGKVHRAWAGFKAKVGGGDHTLLASARQIEDSVDGVYQKAIASEPPLPLPVRQLLASQAAHIKSSHKYIKSAIDKLSQAA